MWHQPLVANADLLAGINELEATLFVVEDVDAGEAFTARNVRALRPGDGLPPKYLERVIGRRAATRISRGTPLRWDHVSA